ncbi:alpha,alpha-trehalose-phosphate synthase (UDP-forming) [Natrialbaceae archaeon A-gly3]
MRHTDGRSSTGSGAERAERGPSAPDSLIVVSNRQPYRHEFADDGSTVSDGGTAGVPTDAAGDDREITVDRPAGGLTAGLDPVLEDVGGTWIAWGDGDADRAVTDERDCVGVPPEDESYTLRRVWLPEEAVGGYYYGFSNQVLWPLCHEFVDFLEFRPEYLEWYREVNGRFADAVVDHVTGESVVWLQDYHLALTAGMIREAVPRSTTIAQFWHVPWPAPEAFRHCPGGRELLVGLLGNDLLGFHVDAYCGAFLDCVERFVPGAVVDRRRGVVHYEGRETHVVATPMGVDAATYDDRAREADGEWGAFREEYDISPGNAIALGVDRLDYSKGIPERLAAVERFLESTPRFRGEFTFVQKATPSRTEIPAYERHGEFVRGEVERINDRFGTDDWQPIVYTEAYLSEEALSALYRRADAMLVSPLYDGMNLVASEYVAASTDGDGALLLSDRAGCHDLLGDFAYSIDPRWDEEFAATIERALTDEDGERRRRMAGLRYRVFEHDLEWWMDAQFGEINRVRKATASHPPRDGPRELPRGPSNR